MAKRNKKNRRQNRRQAERELLRDQDRLQAMMHGHADEYYADELLETYENPEAYNPPAPDTSIGARFGFGPDPKKADPLPDEPWWAQEEDEYELTEYEKKQYGEYKEGKHISELPPEPVDNKKKKDDAQKPNPVAAYVQTVKERWERIDWELVMVRVYEIRDNVGERISPVTSRVDDGLAWLELQLETRANIPENYSRPVTLAVVSAPLVLILVTIVAVLLLTGGDSGQGDNGQAIVETDNRQTQVAQAAQATNTPRPTITRVPPSRTPRPTRTTAPATSTPRPTIATTNTPRPPATAITDPATDAPAVADTSARGAIAPLFQPSVQRWSNDIQRWGATYNLDPDYFAAIMQLETCGNPAYQDADDNLGLFAVPAERFQAGEDPFNVEDNARRAAEYIQYCTTLSEADVAKALACYHATDIAVALTGLSEWSPDTQQYFWWYVELYSDAISNLDQSNALDAWLAQGGDQVCARAAQN
jgi:hypothetical protein